MHPALIVLAIIACGIFTGSAFALGVWYGFWWLNKHPNKVEVIKVPEPFVVKETKEVIPPSFEYPRPGTPNATKDAADKKMAELISDPEI